MSQGASHSCAYLLCELAVTCEKRISQTLDYEKDSLEHLSDNDELFVSNCNDVKAAPYMYLFRINCSLLYPRSS